MLNEDARALAGIESKLRDVAQELSSLAFCESVLRRFDAGDDYGAAIDRAGAVRQLRDAVRRTVEAAGGKLPDYAPRTDLFRVIVTTECRARGEHSFTLDSVAEALDRYFDEDSADAYLDEEGEDRIKRADAEAYLDDYRTGRRLVFYNADGERTTLQAEAVAGYGFTPVEAMAANAARDRAATPQPDNGPYSPALAEAFRQGARELCNCNLGDKIDVPADARVEEAPGGGGVFVHVRLFVSDGERLPMDGDETDEAPDHRLRPNVDGFVPEPDGDHFMEPGDHRYAEELKAEHGYAAAFDKEHCKALDSIPAATVQNVMCCQPEDIEGVILRKRGDVVTEIWGTTHCNPWGDNAEFCLIHRA